MDEEYQRLLSSLRNDTLRQVALLRMEGHTNKQIAEQLDISVRSVIRKVNLIRDSWSHELGQ